MGKLDGKTALIIGASRGIGRAMAIGFAREGADIIGLARNVDALESMAAEVRAMGRQAHIRHFDVLDPNPYPDLLKWLEENGLDYDVTAHLPGGGTFILAETDPRLAELFDKFDGKPPFWTISDEDVDNVMKFIKAVLNTCRYLAPRLMEKGKGSMIFMGSGAGKPGPQRLADYSAEKGAVMVYALAVAHELRPYGVAVNCLLPGMTKTPRNMSPLAAEPDDCVPAAIFLAQQDANGVTARWFDVNEFKPEVSAV